MAKTKPKPAQAHGRKRVDWPAVERDFRTGKFTQVELARKHGVNEATLSRQIKKDQAVDQGRWQPDLTEVVRQATNTRLMTEMVKAEVKGGQEQVKDAVKAAAEVNAQVILKHRVDVDRARAVAMRMLDELDATTTKADELDDLFEKVTDDMAAPSRELLRQQFRDFMRLHSRVGSVQKLMAAIKDAQTLERKAFGLDDDKGGGSTGFEDLVGDLPEAQ